ncbi:unnamed protein product [Rodentolepis nana]|uniref:Uncharacterized protein n=1 Tax=Rodentolepis nana TaxID=102285 RepID=A0A3P7SA41_RODNA|nr:unnamed protein product [Rodentolepis nana]
MQEAFRQRMQAFIARSEARQRLIRLEALERRLKSERSAPKASSDSTNIIPSRNNLPSSFNRTRSWNSATHVCELFIKGMHLRSKWEKKDHHVADAYVDGTSAISQA